MDYGVGKSREVWDALVGDADMYTRTMFYTGHRPKAIGKGAYDLDQPLFREVLGKTQSVLKYVYEKLGIRRLVFGGALSFDKIEFYAVYQMKQLSDFQDLKLVLAIPFEEQPLSWVADDVVRQVQFRDLERYPTVGSWFDNLLQTDKTFWGRTAIKEYLGMIARADHVVYVDELDEYKVGRQPVGKYHVAKLQKRNEAMVDLSVVGQAFFNGASGGTFNCIEYAHKQNKSVIVLWPGTYEVKVLKP